MTGALLFLQSLSPARLTRRSCLSRAGCFAGSPCSAGRITGLCRGHLEARDGKAGSGARRSCFGKVFPLTRFLLRLRFPSPALGGIHCAAGPNPLPENLQWVSPPPHPTPSRHTTTHSPPFRSSLLAAIETSLPGPGPRRAAVAIQSPFPGSPEPAPGSGLVLFWTLRGTRLWWRSLEPTGSGVCHSPVGQICCSSRLAEP